MDDFPRELMGVIVRDCQIYKPKDSIEVTAKVRHIQVDAMLPNARYPCIIQPKLVGVDRRAKWDDSMMDETHLTAASIDANECFWMKKREGEPVLDVLFSYVPQR